MTSDNRKQSGADKPWDQPEESSAKPRKEPTENQLRAAIRKTLEQAAQEPGSEPSARSPLEVVVEVARRHPTADAVVDPRVAAELVCELGRYALPAQIFSAVIERASPEIASALLADPIAAQHLGRAWLSARTAAGLIEP